MRRSRTVPLGSMMLLASGFLAACSTEPDRETTQAQAECAVQEGDEYRIVDEDDCDNDDGGGGFFWIYMPPGSYGHDTKHPVSSAHSAVKPGSPGAPTARGAYSVPARGGFGGSGGGSVGG